jgi:large subunit ribosomal protein L7Ae
VAKSKPLFVKYGLQNVTSLVEQNEAKLVVIAHDVDPIELVVWLPTLCQKKNIPYVIVKVCYFIFPFFWFSFVYIVFLQGKARLGNVVGQKTAAVLALTNVNAEDRVTLTQLAEVAKTNFNDRAQFFRRTWGGLSLGVKSQHAHNMREKQARAEADALKSLAK